VATVFELGKHQDTYWIAMEYLHGEPLREVMRHTEEVGQPMPPEIACRVIADAAEGLHAAHELLGRNGEKLGLVHRDVTPHNLFVTYDGSTKVVDFGIAKHSSRTANTRAGTLKGKLAYMAPEQVRGEQLDRRTDVFALGVVLWELTTGRRLFRMDSDIETLAKVQACVVPRPGRMVRGYPADLEAIVMKALARDRIERQQTARELSRALQSWLMRRGQFVGGDELAAYMASIFGDRLQERDAHLRWAADVTQTMDIDEAEPPATRRAREDATTLSYGDSDVQLAPPATRGPPREEPSPPREELSRALDADDTVVCDSMPDLDGMLRPAAPSAPPPAPAPPPRTLAPAPPPRTLALPSIRTSLEAPATQRSTKRLLVWRIAVGSLLVSLVVVAMLAALGWRHGWH
jgi:serine/threonine-protein kinase